MRAAYIRDSLVGRPRGWYATAAVAVSAVLVAYGNAKAYVDLAILGSSWGGSVFGVAASSQPDYCGLTVTCPRKRGKPQVGSGGTLCLSIELCVAVISGLAAV
jgi:hypothetical protein